MSSTAHSYPFHLRAGAIKRVVRRGEHYLCGLCRSPYRDEMHAVGCLTHCWGELLRLDPVLPRRHGLAAVSFRCRFCARDFVKREDAHACATDCRDRHRSQHAAALAVLATDEITPSPRHHFRRLVPAQAFVIAPARKPRKAAPGAPKAEQAAASAPPAAAAGEASPAASAPPAAAEAPPAAQAGPEAPPKKDKGTKAFIRDGAEYVCTFCSSRYFTKLEVTKCFEAH